MFRHLISIENNATEDYYLPKIWLPSASLCLFTPKLVSSGKHRMKKSGSGQEKAIASLARECSSEISKLGVCN